MKTSEQGVAALIQSEGLVTRAYRDVAGIWTIGVGHTASAGAPKPVAGMTITRDEAIRILKKDLVNFEGRVNAALPGVPQHVFDGAVSFDFNTGRIHNASWVKLYRAGNLPAAERSLKSWNKAGGKVVKGLVNRREDEADMIFRGIYPDGTRTAPEANDWTVVQASLKELGYDPGRIDGKWGPKTEAAVKRFQKDRNLVVDGIVGPATRATLQRALAERDTPTSPDIPVIDAEPQPATRGFLAWLLRLLGLT